jgi:hypothetical protein
MLAMSWDLFLLRKHRRCALQSHGVQEQPLCSYAVRRFSMTVKETSKQIAVRIGPPLLSAIERRAEQEHRTLAGMIKHLCATGLEGRRDEQTEAA